jgi:hypothetical protein
VRSSDARGKVGDSPRYARGIALRLALVTIRRVFQLLAAPLDVFAGTLHGIAAGHTDEAGYERAEKNGRQQFPHHDHHSVSVEDSFLRLHAPCFRHRTCQARRRCSFGIESRNKDLRERLDPVAALSTSQAQFLQCGSDERRSVLMCRSAHEEARLVVRQLNRRSIVGKYVLAWLLGVPAFVLVIIYLLFH